MILRQKTVLRALALVILAVGGFLYFTETQISFLSRKISVPDFARDVGEKYTFRNATHHRLTVEWLDAPNDPGPGGAIVAWGNGLLNMKRTGQVYVWQRGMTAFQQLDISPPFNLREEVSVLTLPLDISSFGIHGIALRTVGDALDLFAVHTRVHHDLLCVALAVSRTRLSLSAEGLPVQQGGWRTVYETQPCLGLNYEPFLLQIGGATTFTPDGNLLVQVGDFGLDNLERKTSVVYPQVRSTDYGKLLRIHPDSGEKEIVSIGHRNASGITVDDKGQVWMVEHGPRGGDELNLIRPGANYGWPTVTLGAEYTSFDWPANPRNGRHDSFEEPVFSWLPSLAPSSILQVTGEAIPAWRGDLVMGTLAGMSLVHLRLAEGPKVVFAEEVNFGARIRSMAQLPDGTLALKLDAFPNVLLVSADTDTVTDAGELPAALAGCAGCHAFTPGGPALSGPNLTGVWGRAVASDPGYDYSEALSAAQGNWTRLRLKAFLGEPRSFAAGSTMPNQELKGEALDTVLAALEALSGSE